MKHCSSSWNPKQPFINGCLVKQPFSIYRFGIIQLKHPFINGCLGFQVVMGIESSCPKVRKVRPWHKVPRGVSAGERCGVFDLGLGLGMEDMEDMEDMKDMEDTVDGPEIRRKAPGMFLKHRK